MKEQEEKIYLSQEGYQKYLKSIDDLKEEIRKNNLGRKNAFDAGAGDGWDSPEFEEIERNERRLLGELEQKQRNLERIVIVEKSNDNDIIDVDDTVVVDMVFSEDDSEELVFKLVGADRDIKAEIEEVSLSSPLGKAVYKKHIGDECSYSVNNNNISVIIKDKLDLEKDVTGPEKKLVK